MSNVTEPARCPEMGESEGKQGAAFPSEASRMLEAALEQMDGIIQGAKYELPHYFDNFSIQVSHYPLTFTSEQFPTKDSPQQSEVGEAVKRLREAIQEGGNRGPQAQVIFGNRAPHARALDFQNENMMFLETENLLTPGFVWAGSGPGEP